MWERYFDNAATTPVDPRVLDEMLPYLRDDFGNANSIHGFGQRAMAAVDLARERVSNLIGAEDPGQIVFTSGATEANNWVISAFSNGAISPFEHSAVREPALRKGMKLLANDDFVLFPPTETLELISVMCVNNEIGTTWNAADFRSYATHIHSDMTQQLGKTPILLDGIDYASFSSHKAYGPKGVGALYFETAPPYPFQIGGEQEHGYRAGTLNVPGIVGFGAACAIAADEQEQNFHHAARLRSVLLEELGNGGRWQINGEGAPGVPHILSISFDGIEGETLVVEADQAGFAISAGAACSSRSTEPSHVLTALGFEESRLRGTVRISFGKFNSVDSVTELAKTLRHSVEKLRRMM
ncbi:cysteine desulfurase family protein [Fimbriimonas ginsengisoli]|uniref:cysteine desulfurase family protein n=1 Tax=Fimbriimonas ginsengisoli TaxID=1005039 RepID=UPI00130E1296|nr:cysteine desulfurase family protein [Fimbriimonas ginsengisoli]